MAEIVNLRTKKKQSARKAARDEASARAAKFGLSKSERALEKARAGRAARALDAHRLETD